jgi:hypothetical protein
MKLIAGPRETLSTLSSSKGITATILLPTSGTFIGKKCEMVLVQPKTQAVYIMLDGTAATSAGLYMAVDDSLEVKGYENCQQLRVLEAAASATLLVIPFYSV